MAASSVLIPVVVAVIAVIGGILPIYIGTTHVPALFIYMEHYVHPDHSGVDVSIVNNGNSPATNLSITLTALYDSSNIMSITNKPLSSKILYNNTVLQPGFSQPMNQSMPEIRVPKLVPGEGSRIFFSAVAGNASDAMALHVVHDQGSHELVAMGDQIRTTIDEFQIQNTILNTTYFILNPVFLAYYAIFFGLIYLYHRIRKRTKFPTKVAKDIMETRKLLRSDVTSRSIFSEAWVNVSDKKRQTVKNIDDYLLIDDFYQDLKKRNEYLERSSGNKESDLSRANALSKLNESLLAAAENVLNKVDWNKYR